VGEDRCDSLDIVLMG